MMRKLLILGYIITLALANSSCSSDKSQKYIGKWTNVTVKNYFQRNEDMKILQVHSLNINKIGDNFKINLVRNKFVPAPFNGNNSGDFVIDGVLPDEEVIGTYDKEHDKLALNNTWGDILYDSEKKLLILTGHLNQEFTKDK